VRFPKSKWTDLQLHSHEPQDDLLPQEEDEKREESQSSRLTSFLPPMLGSLPCEAAAKDGRAASSSKDKCDGKVCMGGYIRAIPSESFLTERHQIWHHSMITDLEYCINNFCVYCRGP